MIFIKWYPRVCRNLCSKCAMKMGLFEKKEEPPEEKESISILAFQNTAIGITIDLVENITQSGPRTLTIAMRFIFDAARFVHIEYDTEELCVTDHAWAVKQLEKYRKEHEE